MKRTLIRTALTLIAIAWPLSVNAAPPSVTGIQATYDGEAVHVRWDAPVGATTIVYYHVYYSRKSILENDGQYDDFETTTGRQSGYDLRAFPPTDALYVSVLAVDDQGNESEFFAEEAKVDVNTAVPPQPSFPPQQMPGGSTVQLLSAASLSETGVVLTFSEPVTVAPADALTAFQIDDGSGHTLGLRRLIFQNNTVMITTMPQQPGIRYIVHVSPVVRASAAQPDGTQIPMDPVMNTASFGEADSEPEPSPTPPPENVIPSEVTNLHLDAQPGNDGTYTIVVAWDVPEDGSIDGQNVMQTTDGGQTYSPAQSIGPAAHTVRINGVTPGSFGILVQTVSRTGNVSAGEMENIELPVIEPPKKDLTKSGPEVLLAFAIAGAGMGWFRSRRKLKIDN